MLLMLFLNCINVLSLEIAVSSTAAVVLLALLYNVDWERLLKPKPSQNVQFRKKLEAALDPVG